MNQPKITLKNNKVMPQIGLGLWHVKEPKELRVAFDTAINSGYRLFDTAQAYHNEQMLGLAIKAAAVKRQDLFITTKITVTNFGYKKTVASAHESLEKLGLDYVDLMLLHFPVSIFRKRSWQALEELKEQGLFKSIGVSNYTIHHLEEMKTCAQQMPVVNQVELHVFLQQPELIEYCHKENIAVEAYSPLAHAAAMDDPVINSLAKKYSKSYAQIMLRYLIQLGLIVIPKSVTPSRIKENIDIFDFKIEDSDMEKLRSLDRDLRTCWNPTHVP